ncbi:MAG TPA: MMPL family transporter [Thermoplasmata archaeon]|nr:MMPL family transporter [Thermoplasmata archaeon]
MTRHTPRLPDPARPLATRPWTVVAVWALFFLVATPSALLYTHAINYSSSGSGPSGTESARAASAIAAFAPANSTLLIAIQHGDLTASELEARTLELQANLSGARIPYFAGSSSVYSAYSAYLDGAFGALAGSARSVGANVTVLSSSIYGLPSSFLLTWTAVGATRATINSSFASVGGSPTGYDDAVRGALWAHFAANESPADQLQAAIQGSAPRFFAASGELTALLRSTNVSVFADAVPTVVASLLDVPGLPLEPPGWVEAALDAGDFGSNYVRQYGTDGVPTFLDQRFTSPDGSLSLVVVAFSVPEAYRTADGTYPAQGATPTVRALADRHFGSLAAVTGQGAAAYDSQQLAGSSGALFALVFVLLAAAVALTLRSWIAPILALLLVSLSTVLGYLAIEATSLLVGKVDFTATYTVTAVTLGIATDYLLFIAYRYREELTRGVPPEDALRTATERSGFAVLVSAATVAVGLGSLSFLPGLQTWGPTLAITVLLIALLEVTLLPALLRIIGPRFFLRRWMRPARPWGRSRFYRAAARSTASPYLVAGIAAVIAVPAVAGFLVVPTTYDVAGVQPSSLPSSVGLAEIEHGFGANLLYPTYVIVTSPGSYLAANGSLNSPGAASLHQVAADLLGRPGVSAVEGPFAGGANLTGPSGATGFVFDGGRRAYFLVYSNDGPYTDGALQLVRGLRADPEYLVGGVTSTVIDQQAANSVQYPLFELILVALIGLILGLSFRSLAVPFTSISGVFLSISATTGLLYLIARFLLHQALLFVIPLILFVILMSLGNDYTVFLIARIREEQLTAGSREGIHRGIAGSGVVVSALGLILAASLGSLALQPLAFLQELGLAFVLSLVLDTFLIRPFYFPALLQLLGRRTAPDGSPVGTAA